MLTIWCLDPSEALIGAVGISAGSLGSSRAPEWWEGGQGGQNPNPRRSGSGLPFPRGKRHILVLQTKRRMGTYLKIRIFKDWGWNWAIIFEESLDGNGYVSHQVFLNVDRVL